MIDNQRLTWTKAFAILAMFFRIEKGRIIPKLQIPFHVKDISLQSKSEMDLPCQTSQMPPCILLFALRSADPPFWKEKTPFMEKRSFV